MIHFIRFMILTIIIVMVAGCKPKTEQQEKGGKKMSAPTSLLNINQTELSAPAPEKYQIKFETSKGNFVMEVTREWSPHGADRLYYLVKNNFYDGVRFFRVISDFMAQFGYHGDPEVSRIWCEMNIPDDPVKQSNLRGYVSYAMANFPNSRSTQLFINFKDNTFLDKSGFAPVGKIIEGMEVVDQLYSGYGEGAPQGAGPEQGRIMMEGNEYLTTNYPDLDYIKMARIL
jgi:peptidyl-prolyl cis-trans isomerase A (cyclophilin A)